jgi:hypothetical protein
MTDYAAALAQLVDTETFRESLRAACIRRPGTTLTVGVAAGDFDRCFECSGDDARMSPSAAVAPGCLTKLFTGALAIESLQEQGLPGDLEIAEPLGIDGDGSERLRLRHLLDHTHGLDTSMTQELRFEDYGQIDRHWLARRLCSTPKIAEPGAMHSYANASAWLAAALIEKISATTCANKLLRSLDPEQQAAGIHWNQGNDGPSGAICAATGRDLKIPAAVFLEFLKSFWNGNRRGDRLAESRWNDIVPLPGWSGPEVGVLGGWKSFGNGWFGHSSVQEGCQGLVRVHPVQRVALFVCSKEQNCNTAAVLLFGRHLPTLVPSSHPRMLPANAASADNAYLGVYDVAATRIFIERAERGGLKMRAYRRGHSGLATELLHSCSLRAANDHLFYTRPVHAELFPYLQFVGPAPFGHVWNGKWIWRRNRDAGTAASDQ